jgi:hypothetical protein
MTMRPLCPVSVCLSMANRPMKEALAKGRQHMKYRRQAPEADGRINMRSATWGMAGSRTTLSFSRLTRPVRGGGLFRTVAPIALSSVLPCLRGDRIGGQSPPYRLPPRPSSVTFLCVTLRPLRLKEAWIPALAGMIGDSPVVLGGLRIRVRLRRRRTGRG